MPKKRKRKNRTAREDVGREQVKQPKPKPRPKPRPKPKPKPKPKPRHEDEQSETEDEKSETSDSGSEDCGEGIRVPLVEDDEDDLDGRDLQSLDESNLRELCQARSLECSGSRSQLIARLVLHHPASSDDDETESGDETPDDSETKTNNDECGSEFLRKLTTKELKKRLAQKGLKVTGNKDVLVSRLVQNESFSLDWEETDFSSPLPAFTRDGGPAHLYEEKPRGRPSSPKAVDFFLVLITIPILELLVAQTNTYAMQCGSDFVTNIPEMKAFIALMILSGMVAGPDLEDMFSDDPKLGNAWVKERWTRQRFRDIRRYFHVSNKRDAHTSVATGEPCDDTLCNDPAHDKLQKLRPFLTLINASIMAAWHIRQNNAVDEVIAAFKGQTRMKAYIPTKKHQWGIKIWKACDSASGYMWAFLIYTGADRQGSAHGPFKNLPSDGGDPWSLGEKVVLYFACLLEQGAPWVLFLDNYFTTVRLLIVLLGMGIYATGTINVWTAMFPQILLLGYAKLKKAARGTSSWVMTKVDNAITGVLIVMWNDSAPKAKKKAVSFASTSCGPGSTSTVKRWVRRVPEPFEISQPIVSREYNPNYGGVDRGNKGAAVYKICRATNKWWWAVFWHIMDSVIFNAWILMYPDGAEGDRRQKTHKAFRLALVDQLTGDYNVRQRSHPSTEHVGRYDGFNHWPVKSQKKANKGLARCACGCKNQSSYECFKCRVALKIECFRDYHTQS